jgi:ubiquinone/menaquinone biosynthesis C-methylase UbiE
MHSERVQLSQPPMRLSLYRCVDWRQWLWYLPTKWAIGNPGRFRGKSVLEIGPGTGLMACYFASLGANVTAADCASRRLDQTTENALRLGLQVRCLLFSGDYNELPSGFDIVFTKSALVMTGQAAVRAAQIPRLLRPGGEYTWS